MDVPLWAWAAVSALLVRMLLADLQLGGRPLGGRRVSSADLFPTHRPRPSGRPVCGHVERRVLTTSATPPGSA